MTDPKFDFWKSAEAPSKTPPAEVKKPKKREVVGTSEADLAAKRESIIRDSVRKLAIEKNISYGTTQEFFCRPENADKKSILEYRLGIDLDQYPVNSDVFMSALADFQQIHNDVIGYDPDGWFANIPGRGPTPTWKAMFDGFVIPGKAPKKEKDAKKKPEKNQYRGIDIPDRLSPTDMAEWTQDIDALWLIDGLKNVTYDRRNNVFIFTPTGEKTLSREHTDKIPPEFRRGYMIDWVGDRNAKQLIKEGAGELLAGLGYNDVQNVYTYQGQEFPRDYQSIETLRNWQNDIVPRYIVATLGGEKLREFYTAWESAPNKYSFSGLINKFWPGIPFPTKADVQDASAGKHDPLHGAPPTDEQFRKIFEKIQTNGGYPPADLLPAAPQIKDRTGNDINPVQLLVTLMTLSPIALKTHPLVPGNEYARLIHNFATPLVEAKDMLSKAGNLNVDSFAGDTLQLINIRNRLTNYHKQADKAQDRLRWNWNTSPLLGADAWHTSLHREVESLNTLIKQVEEKGTQKQDNLLWTETQISTLRDDLLDAVSGAITNSDLKKEAGLTDAFKKVTEEKDLTKKIPLLVAALKLVNPGLIGKVASLFSSVPDLIEKLEKINAQPDSHESVALLLESLDIAKKYNSVAASKNISGKLSKYQSQFGFYTDILKNQLPSVTQVREAYRLSDDSDGRADDRLFKKVPFTVPVSFIERIIKATVPSDSPMTLPAGNATSSPEDIVSDEIFNYVSFSQDALPTSIHVPVVQYTRFLSMLQNMTSQPLTYSEHSDKITTVLSDPTKTILENILFNYITLPPNS